MRYITKGWPTMSRTASGQSARCGGVAGGLVWAAMVRGNSHRLAAGMRDAWTGRGWCSACSSNLSWHGHAHDVDAPWRRGGAAGGRTHSALHATPAPGLGPHLLACINPLTLPVARLGPSDVHACASGGAAGLPLHAAPGDPGRGAGRVLHRPQGCRVVVRRAHAHGGWATGSGPEVKGGTERRMVGWAPLFG